MPWAAAPASGGTGGSAIGLGVGLGNAGALAEAASRLRGSFDAASIRFGSLKKTASFREPLTVAIPPMPHGQQQQEQQQAMGSSPAAAAWSPRGAQASTPRLDSPAGSPRVRV